MDTLKELDGLVDDLAGRLSIPGVAVGVWHEGREHYVFRGVTSVPNPLPVDASTVFQFGSITKTFTATALMCLVEQGLVELGRPVVDYLPGLRLADPYAREHVTVLQLLNHTAGWAGDVNPPSDDGDVLESFARYLATVPQISPPGEVVSYSNSALSLAGYLIQVVTGRKYASAIAELLLEPLGLADSYLDPTEVMIRRFAVGHESVDGRGVPVGPWPVPQFGIPAGGLAGTARDLLAWARFHLSDGREPTQSAILSPGSLRRMREPTADCRGSALGDSVGIGWFLRTLGDRVVAGHSGVTKGQVSRLDLVPECGFAIGTLTNSGTTGARFIMEVHQRALAELLGLRERPAAARPPSEAESAQLVGWYETLELSIDVAPARGGLLVTASVAPLDPVTGVRTPTGERYEIPVQLLDDAGSGGFVATGGVYEGMRGRFVTDAAGAIDALDLGGRLARRVIAADPEPTTS